MSFLHKLRTKTGEVIKLPQIFHEVLIMNGSWPVAEGDDVYFKSKLYNLFGWIVLLNMALVNFAQIGNFIENVTDIIAAAQSFCTALTGFFVVLRSLYFMIFSKKFELLLTKFSQEIWIDGKKYPRLTQKYHRFMLPVFAYFILILVTLLMYVFLPIVVFIRTNQTLDSQDKGMPFLMAFPYDVQKTIPYIISYISTICGGYTIASLFYAQDAILLFCVSYLCGQLEIMHADIVRLIPECHAEWQNHLSKTVTVIENCDVQRPAGRIKLLQKMYNKRLHLISARHHQLISFCNQLHDFVSMPLLINVITSTFLICFCGFQFVISGTTSMWEFCHFSSFFMSVIIQLYVICTGGTLLISTSSETAFYLYLCNWEGGQLSKNSPLLLLSKEMGTASLDVILPLWKFIKYHPTDKDFRNKLRFMIMRSQSPLQLTAMNFTVLSLESFTRILSSSMSYFTLLKTFLQE